MTFSITGAHCECLAEGCRAMALYAEIERLRAALEQCAAPFSTKPGTVAACQAEIGAEFQRRMDIAGIALANEQDGDGCCLGLTPEECAKVPGRQCDGNK